MKVSMKKMYPYWHLHIWYIFQNISGRAVNSEYSYNCSIFLMYAHDKLKSILEVGKIE
jgi:hypothetical protein